MDDMAERSRETRSCWLVGSLDGCDFETHCVGHRQYAHRQETAQIYLDIFSSLRSDGTSIVVHHALRWKGRELRLVVVGIPQTVLVVDVHGRLEVVGKLVALAIDVSVEGAGIETTERCSFGSLVDGGTTAGTLPKL